MVRKATVIVVCLSVLSGCRWAGGHSSAAAPGRDVRTPAPSGEPHLFAAGPPQDLAGAGIAKDVSVPGEELVVARPATGSNSLSADDEPAGEDKPGGKLLLAKADSADAGAEGEVALGVHVPPEPSATAEPVREPSGKGEAGSPRSIESEAIALMPVPQAIQFGSLEEVLNVAVDGG